MSLTGLGFYDTTIVATLLAVTTTMLLWSRVRGMVALRALQRIAMLVMCQLCAIVLTMTWVNNHFGLYASWSDLPGTGGSGHLVMSGPPPETADFSPAARGTESTFFRGPASRLAGEVFVWTPPQYHQAAYKHDRFPVIELLHGVPGEAQDWLIKGGMPGRLATMMAHGTLEPAIVVMPTLNPGGVDTDCTDTPRAKVATWLAKDVPRLLSRHFRVLSDPKGWALAGLSTGGFCAIKLSLQYPKKFGIGAGMDSDPFTGDPAVLADTALRTANAPVTLAQKRPPVQLFAGTSAQDHWSPPSHIFALQRAVRYPTVLAPPYILSRGGHNWGTWGRIEPALFAWMNTVLAPPQSQTSRGTLGGVFHKILHP
ncbi:MAG TPA: alpha/beta hydrolase-fold protein [Flexivirga sp.]|uniref:alpha/beta hydrolase n=1 Tax=Flexivirga sp. TaxID=1962927 RepID=UPI002C9FA226|nr:alpha/beta hydrolase-fold protein [Flexivirga sp.]HWC22676.1 alpha/beta hydrolase-fold protein [Flexivirga sp.]